MQTKPVMRYYRPTRMAKIKLTIPSVAKNAEQQTFPYFARGSVKQHNTVEDCSVVSYQVKHIPTICLNNSTPPAMKCSDMCKVFLTREACLSCRVQGSYWGPRI